MRQVCSATLAAIAIISAFTPSNAFGQAPPTGLSITNYQIVSEQRASVTQSYYVVRADLVNTGPARSPLTATVTSLVPSITVDVPTNLHFGPIAANSQVTSLDTFTMLVDKTVPLNFSNLQWSFVAPVANAGPNQTASPGSTVTLNGSGSTNPSGIGFLSYKWELISRPPGTSAKILFGSEAITSFTVDVQGEYIARLTVTNGAGTDIAVMKVTSGNSAPVANAGPNQTVSIGATVQLNGSASSDVDGDSLTYSWTLTAKPSGSTAVLSNTTIVNPTFTADKGGIYTAQLVVNDGHGNSSTPSIVTINTQNSPPIANAGPNQVVNVGTTVQLTGAASTDVDGNSLIFQWSLITRPGGSSAALSSATVVNPTFFADVAGTYVAQLVVNDGIVNSSAATVTITTGTVQAPTANAGANQTVQHGTVVTLHGSGTDPQGQPVTFHWALITQPLNSSASLSSTTDQNPTFLADLPGNYVAQLIVNNGSVNSAPSTVSITTTNTAPVANAGVNQSVATGATVSLNGIGSTDADADPLTYVWSFTARPQGSSAALVNANSSAPSFLADVAGTYVVQLIVSDPFSSSVPATVTITASARTITLTPDPLSLFGSPGTFTVSLGEAAQAGGQQINFAVLDPAVATLPASIVIPANAFSANVTVTPGAIGSTLVTASAPGFRPGSATINVGAQSISVTLASSAIGLTKTTTGTVTLSSPAPAAGALVTLSTNPNGIVTLQPTSFTIPVGGNTGTFTVTGAGEGSTTISAASPGYNTGGTSILVAKLGLIQVQPNVTVGPGQSVPLQISLATPAPVGGATITLTSGDTSKLTVTSSVFIAQGQTTPATPAQVTGVDFGSATVSASSPGFNGDSQTVTVAASLSFVPPSLTLGVGGTQNLTLQLSGPSPAALTVSLVSSNPGVAGVPPSVTIAQNATSALVLVTGVSGGAATITATPGSPNVVGTSASVNIVTFGTVVLPGGTSIGLGQSTPVQVSLSSNAAAGGVTVSLSSSDSSVASLSASTVFIAAGTNAPAVQPVINGVAPGTATITASAPGFATASEAVQVLGSFTLTPPNLTIAVGTTNNLTVTLSGPAPAAGLVVNLTSTNQAAATVPSTVTIAANTTTAAVPVTGVAAGSTSIRVAAQNVTQAISNVTVQAGGAISLPSNVTIGPGQSAPFPVTLTSPAPTNVTVSLVSTDTSKVTISPASVNILSGQTQPATQPQVTGVNFGASTISASAPGFAGASQTVQVAGALSFAPPAITVGGGSTQNVTLNLSVSAPAGGLVVNLTSNSGAATVPGSVTIAQNTSSIQVPVTGAAAGAAVISATSVVNVAGATLNVTVPGGGGGNIGLPGSLAVDVGQSVSLPITLPTPAPAGGVIVTLSSSDASKATVSPASVNIQGGETSPAQQPQVTGVGFGSANISASAPGYGSASVTVQVGGTMSLSPPSLTINGNTTQNLTLTLSTAAPAAGLTVNLASGNTGVATVPANVTVPGNTTTASVPVTGVAPGTTTITASATGLVNATASVTVNQGADILLPTGFVVAPGDSPTFQVTLASPATQFTFVSLTSSDTSKATLSLQNLIFQIGSTQPVSQPRINGINPGTVTITASAPGLATATTSVLVGFGFSFSPPNLTITGTSTQNITLSLSSAAPASGIQVNLSSSNPGVAIVNSTAFFPPGVISIGLPVTGVAPGSTVITASSPNVTSGTANVTVVTPGAIGVPATTNVPLGQAVAFPVTLSTAAPAGGVTVNLSSNNTAIATVSPSSVFVAAGQTQPASQPQVHGVNVGGAAINVSATGYSTGSGAVQVGATVTFTTQNVTMGVNTSQTLLLALSAAAPLAGVSVTLTSSNPAVATLQASVNFFPDGSAFTTVAIPVQSLSPGTTTIHASGINIPDATTTVTVFGPVTFTTTSLATGSVGTPYSQTLGVAGGVQPYTFAQISGSLPSGLGLNNATGLISGTPTAVVTNTPLTFRVTDSSAPSQTATVNLTLSIVSNGPASIAAASGTPQSTVVNTQFPAPLVATVRDAGNNPVSGVTVTFTAPGGGPSGSFAGGNNTAVTNGSGQATSAVFTADGTTGSYNVSASVSGVGTPALFALTNTAVSPGTITPVGGTPQSAAINTPFAAPLSALVKDSGGNPLSGVTVTFAAPGSGPSGAFAGGTNTAVTNGSGIATSAAFTANATQGSYTVTASVAGVGSPALFQLTNSGGTPASVIAVSGTPQSAQVNTTFALPFAAQVTDAGGNPVSGVTVTFSAPGIGPSGSFAPSAPAQTNSSGIATSAAFTANALEGSYSVMASVNGVLFPAAFSVTNTPGSGGGGPQLSISSAFVGQGLQTPLTLTLPGPAKTGGQLVTISSGDPSQLLLAGRPGDPGVAQINVGVGEGLTTVSGIFAQGLTNSGNVTVTASAPGFASGIANIVLSPAGFVLGGPNGIGGSFSITQGSPVSLTISAARLDPSNVFAEVQQVRGGTFANLTLSNSVPSVGSLAPLSLTLTGGESLGGATFTAATDTTGDTTLAVQASGFATPANGANTLVVTVTPSGLAAQPVTVGQNLQVFSFVVLNSPAPAAGLNLTLTSSDPSKVLFSTTPAGTGFGTIDLLVPAGRTKSQDFYVQGLASGGDIAYTASAPGFGSSNGTVTLTPSGFVMTGPFGLGQNFPTTSGAPNSQLTLNSFRLTPGFQLAEIQQVRGGLTVNVNVTSSSPSVGSITTSPVAFTGPADTGLTQFDPATSGSTILNVPAPSGFSTPASGATLTVTVTTPQISLPNLTIGRTLQQPGTVILGQAAPAGGLPVTVTSNAPGLVKLSATQTGAGSTSIVIMVPAGATSATFFVQAFSDTGTGMYTASASGYVSKTATVTFAPSGLAIAGPFGFFNPLVTSVSGPNPDKDITVSIGILDPNNGNSFVSSQSLAGGTSLSVLLTNATPNVGTANSPVTISGGTDSKTTIFHPLTPGDTTISVNNPAGYTPSDHMTLAVHVNP